MIFPSIFKQTRYFLIKYDLCRNQEGPAYCMGFNLCMYIHSFVRSFGSTLISFILQSRYLSCAPGATSCPCPPCFVGLNKKVFVLMSMEATSDSTIVSYNNIMLLAI